MDGIAKVFKKLANSWDTFWFREADPLPLCVLRILTGGMLFYSLLVWGIKLESFLGQSGFNNAGIVQSLQGNRASFSYWWYVPDAWLWPVHIASMLIAFCFFIGLATRFTGILAWIIAISYANRTMLANYGLDQILCLALMYLMLGPCGAKLSVDQLIRRFRKRESSTTKSVLANVSARLIQVHLCVIYLFAGLSKLQGETWWNGDAIWNVLANYEYQSVDLTFLAGWRFFTDLVAPATVLWEISFCVLVWNRHLRPFVLAAGIAMHLGIGAFLGMWTFGLMMSFCYLGFIPAQRLRQAANLLRIFVSRPDWKLHQLQLFDTDPLEKSPAPARRSTTIETATLPATTSDPSVPVIIVVSNSKKLTSGLIKYFQKYRARVFCVDEIRLARTLLRDTGGLLLAFCPSERRAAELQNWLPVILSELPHTHTVISAPERMEFPNSEFIPLTNTYREIRKAVELQLGCELRRIKKRQPASPDPATDAASFEDRPAPDRPESIHSPAPQTRQLTL